MKRIDALKRALPVFGSRRDFLARLAEAGGYAAAFSSMHALGLMTAAPAEGEELKLQPGAGNGVKVAILGGGIAGLVSAYELGKAGYHCTVLEARSRPGGRNWTVRGGTKVEFTDGMVQTGEWGPDNYLNAGPARLPSIHKTILGYCNELGVPLEVEVNTSRSSLLVNDKAFGGKAIEQRQAVNDTRGHVAELLAKCVNQHALDQQLTGEDHEKMLEFLRVYGDLNRDYAFAGSSRAGVSQLSGAGPVREELRPPLPMHALLDAEFWRSMMFEEQLDMQATMFQPVGGMDRIPYAFARKLGSVVQYDCPVKEIRKTEKGVRITYAQAGATKTLEADYCICAMPITILKNIPNDFSPRIKQAIKDTEYMDAYKVGWESKRFWETDFNIYGGISWVMSGPVGLVWYPSGKIFSETGVVVSGYATEGGSEFGKLPSVDAKIAASRVAVEKLHPGYGKQLNKPIYVYWAKVPYNLGSWVGGRPAGAPAGGRGGQGGDFGQRNAYYDGPYQEFTKPDDRFFFAGDHCSRVGAWQEGAALAAHRAIMMMSDRVKAARLTQSAVKA
jgi:monoamine oxidase